MVLKGPRSGLELKFYDIASKILSELSLEMYDLEWSPPSGELRLFIMNPATKTAVLDDCVKVDRAFNPYVESETWIPDNFTLEVSSPGLFRNLSTVDHFKGVEGQDITLGLLKKIDETVYPDFPKALRNNLKIKVRLVEATHDSLVVDAKGAKESVRIEVPYTQIKKANLETDFNNNPQS